ncbi:30S ribosomal protein S8 [bacterium]|jgi:small subunit ribosomal protein S8|nr:30S ribosomal protein S8 [bacterium]MBT4121626.1 30S ribosomal protein S8 [bacterium]MBT4335109.1 30S ribosomal protein S8 [bacterium]MBT4495272.1 30S ribosomal protein S8 [bacterium]MBT4763896.1 30S ribosomal protein S8 [bacterium]
MMTDPIADMLTRIRNAVAINKPEVILPYSKIKHEIAKILKSEGYVSDIEKVEDNFNSLKLVLKYNNKESVISHIKRVSKPGRRVYIGRQEIPYILNDLGIAILSTSQGVMSNRQARRARVGGEIICEIW